MLFMMELNPNPSNDTGAAEFVFKCQHGLNTVLSDYLVGAASSMMHCRFNTDYKLLCCVDIS